MADTLRFPLEELDELALGETLQSGGPRPAHPATTAVPVGRSTVLPLFEGDGTPVALEQERFEPAGRLGRGGMAEVELLHDRDMLRSIAVKRLDGSERPELVRRFVAEIRTVARLEHPNIVPVHDVGQDAQGRLFFLMKHLRGETLERLIARLRSGDAEAHRRFGFAARVRLFSALLDAVAYAHDRGVLHRDLKPANIMVGDHGEVTLVDWGIACALHPAQAGAEAAPLAGLLPREPVGMLVGTPYYMSPEQARGENDRLDQRSDVYSLGVVLHELLFLDHYLNGQEGIEAVLAGVQRITPETQEPVEKPGQSVVPPELGWFVHRALQKDPALRFQSVAEMRAELQQVIAGRFRVQCQRTAFKRVLGEVTRFSDRHPKTAIVATSALLSLLLMGAVRSLLSLF